MNNTNNLSAFQNLYEVRKTVRFNLLPVNHKYHKISGQQFEAKLSEFINNYRDSLSNFAKTVFTETANNVRVLNKNTKVSIAWLKTYTKQDFYDSKNDLVKRGKNGQKFNSYVPLQNANFLFENFQLIVERNNFIIESIDKWQKQTLQSQERRSELAHLINQIHQRTNFELIIEFFKSGQSKNDDTLFEKTLALLIKCTKLLQEIESYLLPSQSFGQVIQRASLNYYTVNKKPKDYPEDIRKQNSKKDWRLSSFKGKNNQPRFSIHQSIDFLTNVIANLHEEYFVQDNFNEKVQIIKDWNHLKLQYAYKFLKQYKAQQKSAFLEFLSKYKTYPNPFQSLKNKNIALNLNLLDDISQENFAKILELTKKINAQVKNSVDSQSRGKHFDIQNKLCSFPKYKVYCELFKAIAMEYGKVKAEIRSLEKEQVDAMRLCSWAVILEKNNQHYVMTIPRDRKIPINDQMEYQLPHAYKEVRQLKSEIGSDMWRLYHFESLTLRALEKLCFGMDKNTFITNKSLLDELKMHNSKYFENGRIKRKDQLLKQADDGTWDERELIDFYQTILSLEATKDLILVEEFLPDNLSKNSLCKTRFMSLKNFQIVLEKQCYIRKAVTISDQTKLSFEQKYGGSTFQLTSYDLFEKRVNEKSHTELWKQFWSQSDKSGYTVRLNPEMKISYVEMRTDSVKDKAGNEVSRNRRKEAEYILSLTISENNDKPKFDMAFADKEKVKANIAAFNKTLNEKILANPYDIYYYGIDRGNEELLTLGIFKFENTDVSCTYPSDPSKLESYKRPVPVDLEAWKLPEDKYLELVKYETNSGTKCTEAYKNISYADKAGLLHKGTITSCVDLTSARMIGDKLVINGDIATVINLKLENAKRKLSENINFIKIAKRDNSGRKIVKVEYKAKSKNKAEHFEINITLENGDTKSFVIYWIDSLFEKNKVEPELKKILSDVLFEVENSNNVTIDISIVKINHLRDAICANAVGVLTYLQKKNFGIISFEDLEIEKKGKHFSQSHTNLGSRIEIAVLRKFQTLGLVPPNYKMVISMQSKKEINQLGIISYIETAGTSSNCPHCGQKISSKVRNKHKWKNQKFKCENKNGDSCGFNTYSQAEVDSNGYTFLPNKKGLEFLETSDDIAAYNIAKRGLNLLLNNTK